MTFTSSEILLCGVEAADRLRPGDAVLVAEACSHHPIGDDIGPVKIPRWLEKRVGGTLASLRRRRLPAGPLELQAGFTAGPL